MPRIEQVREPGYYFVIPKKKIPSHPVVEVKPDNNSEKLILDKEPLHPMVFKEHQEFSYGLPQAKLLPPSIVELDRSIKYVEVDRNKEIVEHRTPQVAPNQNREQLLDKGVKQVFPDQNIEANLSTDIKMVKPMTTEGVGSTDIKMVKPMTTEGVGSTDIKMVKPMTTEGVGSTDIKMVKPMTTEGVGSTDIKMVKPMTTEGVGSTDIKMVKPMTTEETGSHGIVSVLPMFKEELIPSNRPGVTWSKGVVLSKYPMVQGADLMDSLKEHFFDTIERMTTGFVEDIKDWMKQKRETLKKEFHNFVSTTMRDYENALMDPARTLIQNAISNPLGTISDFPRNIKTAFGDTKQGIINTSVDKGVAIGNKAIDTLNAGIAMGNTGVEALNAVNKFFGGKGKSLPVMKTIPRLPSREELLNQAVMKGGSIAKMNSVSNFDVAAFKEAAEEGKIDRETLINMGSTPTFNNSLPDDYSQWGGAPLWFTLQDDNVTIDEKNPPIILDNTGKETIDQNKKGRKLGEKSYNYMGYREGPFKSAMEGIYRGTLGFQAQPDIYCDINIEPYKFPNAGTKLLHYYPPPYPKDKLGDFMIADFQVQHIVMNTEEQWNLGAYGSIPTVVNYILPSSLSIRFVGDANLKTAKWLTAYQEYMTGYKLNLHVMRPYKMCCQAITIYALTFYGEVVHAKTFLAYPLLKDDYSMLGSGGAKHFDVDWVVVGLKEFKGIVANQKKEIKPDTSTTADDAPEDEEEAKTSSFDEENNEIADTTASSAFLKSNSSDVDGKNSDVDSVDKHTEGFLDKVKNSSSVAAKLKELTENDAIKDLVEKTGTGKYLDMLNKAGTALSDLDKLVRVGCNYLVCAYTNHIAQPSYGETQLPYNSTDTQATFNNKMILHARFKACDQLAIKRAAEYVNSLLNKGVARDNIKVIIASCDGIPGMDHFIKGTAMSSSFYLGGIYQYTKAECEMDSGDGNTPGLVKNRRVDLIYFDDFVADCADAINDMMGKGSSDARGSNDKLKLLWNRIPKVSYGRDNYWGASLSLNRFPLYTKEIDLGINGFSNVEGKLPSPSTDGESNEEKYDKLQKEGEENDLKVDSGLGSEEDLEKNIENYKKGEEVKETTENKSKDYALKSTASYQDFTTSMQDSKWFNSHFPKKYRKDLIANNTTVWDFYSGENASQYISTRARLPKGADKGEDFPILVMNGSIIKQNNIMSFKNPKAVGSENYILLNYYFDSYNFAWIYTSGDGILGFWCKTEPGSSTLAPVTAGSSTPSTPDTPSAPTTTPSQSKKNYKFGENYKLQVVSNTTTVTNDILVLQTLFPKEVYDVFQYIDRQTGERVDIKKASQYDIFQNRYAVRVQGIYQQGSDINAYLSSLYRVPLFEYGGMYYVIPYRGSTPPTGNFITPPDYAITLCNYIFSNQETDYVAAWERNSDRLQFWEKIDTTS